MLARPALLIAALLAVVALTSLAALRRLAREQLFIAKLRDREAVSARQAVRMSELSADEQDTARELMAAGVVRGHGRSCYLEPGALGGRRRKRTRLTLSSALMLALAVVAALLMLRR